jgi:hypothetical protein
MAKQRLVDFRGGINEKVSPHMIGDTQGQDAVDLDFSTVRLEGRDSLNASDSASGSFLYDVGDGADPISVSIYPSDSDTQADFNPYIQYASDFAVWNRDLYVAMGAPVVIDNNLLRSVVSTDHAGDTVRYLDGVGSAATPLSFLPPSAVTVTVTDNWNTLLVPTIPEVSAPAGSGQTGIVTTNTITTASDFSTINLSTFSSFGITYTLSSGREEAAAGGRTYYTKGTGTTKYYVGGSGTSTFTNETTGYLYTRSYDVPATGLPGTSTSVSTANNDQFSTTSTGAISTSWNFTQSSTQHGVDANNVAYYVYTSSHPDVSGQTLYGKADTVANFNTPIVTGTPSARTAGVSFSGTVTESNYTSLGTAANPYYRLNGATVPYYTLYGTSPYTWSDSRTGTSSQVFKRYSDTLGTVYYAPQSPLQSPYTGLTVGNFYTQSGGSGTTGGNSVTDPNTTGTYNASTDYWKWVRDAAFTGNVTTSNYSTLNSSYGTSYSPGTTGYYDQRSGTSNQTFNLYTEGGTTYYAPTSNATINGVSLTAGTFYTQGGGGSTTSSTEGPYVYNGYFWYVTDINTTNRIEIYWGGVLKATVTPANLTEHVASDGYKYIRGNLAQSANWPHIYTVSRNITTNNDFTYSAHSRTLSSSNGTLYFVFGGSTKSTTSNISYATAESSNTTYTTTETINGSSVSVTYRRGTNFAVNQTDTKAYSIYRTYTTPVFDADYTYTVHTRSEALEPYNIYPTTQAQARKYAFPTNMTYSVWSDTLPTVSSIPSTPAFYYDDARSEIYQKNTSSGTPATINDESRGDNWLGEGRAFSGPNSASSYGYFLKSVRGSAGLPTLSNLEVRATFSGTDVMQTDALHSPQRINFAITSPSDNSAQGGEPDAYRLYRKDNNGTVDLGYIKPSRLNTAYTTDIAFSFNSTNKQITISNLLSTKTYRLKWWAYQQSRVSGITFNGSTTSYSSKSNTTGVTIENPTTSVVVQLETSPNGDTKMYACDFWLEESILAGSDANSLLDDTFATVKCYDVLYDIADSSISGDTHNTVQGTSDFLDLFASSLLSDGLGNSSTVGNAPDYCKFLKESNNFFFAVGTNLTDASLYGGTNKKGSFLFISEYNDPTTWHSTGYLQFDSEITGLHTYPGELIVWTSNGTYRVTGSRYDQMRKTKLATTEGMPDGQHRTATLVNNYLVWLSQSGICIYDGRGVTNLTRGRFESFGFTEAQKRCIYDLDSADYGTGLHAGQYDGVYYLLGSDETGYSVDFNLEGFPITKVDLKEGGTTTTTDVPVLVYNPSSNRLLSRRGRVAQGSGKRPWTYKTREFDGGAFGSLKLVKSVLVNGTGSGTIQVYLDNTPVFSGSGQSVSIDYTPNSSDQPARIYLPAKIVDSSDNSRIPYRVPIADVWSVEIINWSGQIDWIDTEYEIVSGG